MVSVITHLSHGLFWKHEHTCQPLSKLAVCLCSNLQSHSWLCPGIGGDCLYYHLRYCSLNYFPLSCSLLVLFLQLIVSGDQQIGLTVYTIQGHKHRGWAGLLIFRVDRVTLLCMLIKFKNGGHTSSLVDYKCLARLQMVVKNR